MKILYNFFLQLGARQEPIPDSSKYTAADVRIVSFICPSVFILFVYYIMKSYIRQIAVKTCSLTKQNFIVLHFIIVGILWSDLILRCVD